MKSKTKQLFIKSIFGGISISIASIIYLHTGGIIGAFLFSIGLLMILNMDYRLFTGTVGYVTTNYINKNAIVLIGNVIGCLMAYLFHHPVALEFVTEKLSNPLSLVFVKSMICGLMICTAVECFKRKKDYMVPLCVMGFILFGAEHCIADLCYILTAHDVSIDAIIFLIVVAAGNSVGAILTSIFDLKAKM